MWEALERGADLSFAAGYACPALDSAADGGTAFEFFFFVTDKCVNKDVTLGVGWALVAYSLLSLVFTIYAASYSYHTSRRLTVPMRVAVYASLSLATCAASLILFLVDTPNRGRQYLMASSLTLLFMAAACLQNSWVTAVSRTQWARSVGKVRSRAWNKTNVCLLVSLIFFHFGLVGAWGCAPIQLDRGDVRMYNLSIMIGFVILLVSVIAVLIAFDVGTRKFIAGLESLLENSAAGRSSPVIGEMLHRVKRSMHLKRLLLTVVGACLLFVIVWSCVNNDFMAYHSDWFIMLSMTIGQISANLLCTYAAVRMRRQYGSTGGSSSDESRSGSGHIDSGSKNGKNKFSSDIALKGSSTFTTSEPTLTTTSAEESA